MSTLSLADLGPAMRRELGLNARCCKHACFSGQSTATSLPNSVATIPVLETAGPATPEPIPADLPGAAWLRTGLHRLRVGSDPDQPRSIPSRWNRSRRLERNAARSSS